jgi:enoyl-CoA hydratase/carnithine racemase
VSSGRIGIEYRDGMAFVTLENARRLNAISAAMWGQLQAFAIAVAERDDVGVVLIRGEGDRAFSAGADISGFEAGRAGLSQAKAYDDGVEHACLAFERIPQPTLALIRGACVGAGASLAASCDLRVAADDAFFAVPAAKLGLGYDPRGVRRLVRVFGLDAARTLLYTAGRLPAARAHALGAVHTLAPAAELESAALALGRSIASNAPLTVRAAKAAIRAALSPADGALADAAQAMAEAADASADYVEGREAFLAKRRPRFTGH